MDNINTNWHSQNADPEKIAACESSQEKVKRFGVRMSWAKGPQINTDKPAVPLQGISALTQMKTNQRKDLEECLTSALSQLDARGAKSAPHANRSV